MDTAGGLYANSGANVDATHIGDYNHEEKPQGRIEYAVFNPQTGERGKITDHELMRQATGVGMMPVGLSHDAKQISFQGNKGITAMPVSQILGNEGWQVEGTRVLDADYSQVSPSLRYAMSQPMLENDEPAKMEYLKNRLMKDYQIKNPVIEKHGDDYYRIDPQTGTYYALTNAPGLDMSDLGAVGARAPGFAGSVAGTALGTGAGPVGMMAGSAGGGLAGDAISTGIGAAIDPEFAHAVAGRSGMGMAKDVGFDAGVNALAGAVPWGLGKMGITAPVSAAAKGVGASMKAGGELLGDVGEWAAKSPVARDVGLGVMGAPGSNAGFMMEEAGNLPGYIAKGADYARQVPARVTDAVGRAAQGIGQHPLANSLSEEGAASLRQFGNRTVKSAEGMTADYNAASPVHLPDLAAEEQMRRIGMKAGIGPGGLNTMGAVGRTMENVGKVGKVMQKPAQMAWQGAARTAQGVGRGTQYAGQALHAGANAVAPYETNAAGHLGAEEIFARMRARQRALQAQGFNPKLVPELVEENENALMPQNVSGAF